jgi:hypothetical protein
MLLLLVVILRVRTSKYTYIIPCYYAIVRSRKCISVIFYISMFSYEVVDQRRELEVLQKELDHLPRQLLEVALVPHLPPAHESHYLFPGLNPKSIIPDGNGPTQELLFPMETARHR